MFDFDKFLTFLEDACNHYAKSAPTVSDYCDDLYRRVNNGGDNVRLSEMTTAMILKENGEWEHPNFASNRIYKLMDRLGMNTTGHTGF